MGCGCGGRTVRRPAPAPVEGAWSVAYPHGPVRVFATEDDAKRFAERRGAGYVVLPPA